MDVKGKNPSNNSSLRLDRVTDTILRNATEGLFFLNDKLEINRYYSQSLENILGIPNLENRNFIKGSGNWYKHCDLSLEPLAA